MALPRRVMAWLKEHAPGVHHFLTRDDRLGPVRYAVVREILTFAVVILLTIGLLWGLTGQSLGDSPVVVVESGSMMHCDNGHPPLGKDCALQRPLGLGTIEAGDLVFVKEIHGPGDVATFASGKDGRYGGEDDLAGDVIIFYPAGIAGTPVIHRAMFWLEIKESPNGPLFTIPELDQTVSDPRDFTFDAQEYGLSGACVLDLGGAHGYRNLGPEDSGWITKGDNNACFDESSGGLAGVPPVPVQPQWVLGKARGELPWIGLVKLKVSDWTAGTHNYDNAPGSAKVMAWSIVIVLVAAPFVTEAVLRRRHAPGKRDRKESRGPQTDEDET